MWEVSYWPKWYQSTMCASIVMSVLAWAANRKPESSFKYHFEYKQKNLVKVSAGETIYFFKKVAVYAKITEGGRYHQKNILTKKKSLKIHHLDQIEKNKWKKKVPRGPQEFYSIVHSTFSYFKSPVFLHRSKFSMSKPCKKDLNLKKGEISNKLIFFSSFFHCSKFHKVLIM